MHGDGAPQHPRGVSPQPALRGWIVPVSAHIDASTKRELDEYAEAHGLKQGYLVEEALRHHLRALRELPADVIIPTRVVVSCESGERILERLKRPGKPTKALRELFRKK